MAAAQEKYLTDVALVVLTTLETTPRSFAWCTASKATAKINIEETKGVKLIVKKALKAQKKDSKIITGCEITFEDNVFLPEVVQVVQGGTLIMNESTGKFQRYDAPITGDIEEPIVFNLDVYTANYNAAGMITCYTKIAFPNCTGQPIDLETEDDKFFAPKFTVVSAPNTGEAPYSMEDVAALPVIS